jgi:hypothetical protein
MSRRLPYAARLTILDALQDPALFGRHFVPLASWGAWLVVLKALFALPMTGEEAECYRQHTGRPTPPPVAPAREAWFIIGRRGGKSRIAALVAVFLACFRDYRAVLAPGERATVMVIAADRRQARVVLRYIAGLLDRVPMLAALVERRTAEALHLRNRVTLEVHTASFRAVRGYTVVAAICDEVAFWPSEEAANPDTEITTPSARPWPRCRRPCCSAFRPPMRAGVPCGRPTGSTTGGTAILSWSGRPTRGR